MASSQRSDSPADIDFSVIRTSIDMGHKMIDQILNGIHYGSDEVRNLLYEECDFILECKVCRNLFRSFPNFVAHKRVYCNETYRDKVEKDNLIPTRAEEEIVIVEPEAPEEDPKITSSPVDNQKSVVQKVVNNQFDGKSKAYQLFTKMAENIEIQKMTKSTRTVTITSIPSNTHAVIVSHAKGDHSAKTSLKKSSLVESSPAASGNKPVEMQVDESPPQTKSISNICMKLADKQCVSIDPKTRITDELTSVENRRSRKSVPRKSTEEHVTFIPAQEGSKTKNDSEIRADSNVQHVLQDKGVSSKVCKKTSEPDSSKEWMKFCDLGKNLCKKCGVRFMRSSGLKFHVMNKHGFQIGEHGCPKCDKFYTTVKNAVRHMRFTHSASEKEVGNYIKSVRNRSESELPDSGLCDTNSSKSKDSDSKETSPKQQGKNLLPYETGWKKCEKCNRVFWKAKAFYRHDQHCKIKSQIPSVQEKHKDGASELVKISNKKDKVGKSVAQSKQVIEGMNTESMSNSEQSNTSSKPEQKILDDDNAIDMSSALYKALTENLTTKPIQRSQVNVEKDNAVLLIARFASSEKSENILSKSKEGSTLNSSKHLEVINERPNTRTQKAIYTEIAEESSEADTKKYDTRLASQAKETPSEKTEKVDNVAKERESDKTAHNIKKVQEKAASDVKKVDRNMAETDNFNQDTGDKQNHVRLRSRANSTEKKKESDTNVVVNKESNRVHNTATGKQNNKSLSFTSFSPVCSPVRVSQTISAPTSPTPSLNSNSGDGYSGKFKMTVKEMAELVESASLAKFAKDRKRKARKILTSTQTKGKRPVQTKLSKPLKKQIRKTRLPVKKSYSTRLSTDSPQGYLEKQTSLEHSRRFLREMKRLENSAGLVESNIYSSSSPLVTPRDSSREKPDDSHSDTPRVPRERNQMETSHKDTRSKTSRNDSRVSPRDSSKDRNENQPRSQNTSRDRHEENEISKDKNEGKSPRGDKVERVSGSSRDRHEDNENSKDKNEGKISRREKVEGISSSHNASTERTKVSHGDKDDSTSRSRNTSKDRNKGYLETGHLPKEKVDVQSEEDETVIESSKSSLLISQLREKLISRLSEADTGRGMRCHNKPDDQADLQQVTKTNSLRKKMLAAQKSVNNSKRIMNKRSPIKSGRGSTSEVDSESAEKTSDGLEVGNKKSDVHNHRTRLATGSIYFNSELLKLSPSKAASLEGSPKKVGSDESSQPSVVKRKLSLSPKKEMKKHERSKSGPQRFSLSTGVNKCEKCKKVFWKRKSYLSHRCPVKACKKRSFSTSPEKTGGQETNENKKKPRVEDATNNNVSKDNKLSPGKKVVSKKDVRIAARKENKVADNSENESEKKKVSIKNLSEEQPSTSKSLSEEDSEDESDFSGFSESDLNDNETFDYEYSDGDGEDLVQYVDEQDNVKDATKKRFSCIQQEEEGLVYKSTGKMKGKTGTVEEIWVEKQTAGAASLSDEKNFKNRQYVRDPMNPVKIHCQSNKSIEKLIDNIEMKCLKCNMQYTSISNLRRHVIRHLGWKRYKCKVCMYACYDKSECRLHRSRSHNDQLKNSNFLQFYIDLKQEASKKRNAKRVSTLRSRRESDKTIVDDVYKKPRQTFSLKSTKTSIEHESESTNSKSFTDNSDNVVQKVSKVLPSSGETIIVKSEIRDTSSGEGSDDGNICEEKVTGLVTQSPLAKARMNLSQVLKDN